MATGFTRVTFKEPTNGAAYVETEEGVLTRDGFDYNVILPDRKKPPAEIVLMWKNDGATSWSEVKLWPTNTPESIGNVPFNVKSTLVTGATFKLRCRCSGGRSATVEYRIETA